MSRFMNLFLLFSTSKFTPAKRLIFRLIFLCILTLSCNVAFSAENKAQVQVDLTSNLQPDTFAYVLEGRPDPFVPFISEKAAVSQVDMNEIIDKKVQLTGMQLFEPGQLNLVALVKRGAEDLAMVEDFTGKGYILTEGTLIGRRGVVKDIAPNTVIIEETAETRAGKKIITEVRMTLKKEGEE